MVVGPVTVIEEVTVTLTHPGPVGEVVVEVVEVVEVEVLVGVVEVDDVVGDGNGCPSHHPYCG